MFGIDLSVAALYGLIVAGLTALVYLILKVVAEKTVLEALEKLRLLFKTGKKEITFSVTGITPNLSQSKFGALLVKFGKDEVFANLPSGQQKDADIQNKNIWAQCDYQKTTGELKVRVPLRFHKALGAQFKCFVEADFDTLNALKTVLDNNPTKFDKIDVPIQGKSRIYFLLKGGDLEEVKTIDDPPYINNFQPPK